MLAGLAGGCTRLTGLNPGADVESTASALRALGVSVEKRAGGWTVEGDGVASFRAPRAAIDCGNSGTTMRLLAGVLSGLPGTFRLKGDASLSTRPMGRVAEPLRHLGADVSGRGRAGDLFAPLRVEGGRLRAVRWQSSVASAQVKSALLLAGWVGGVRVEVIEPHRSRDHTERMFRALGVQVRRIRGGARIEPGGTLRAPAGRVPGDPSAGAFFGAAAAALPGSALVLEDVGVNSTRLGFFRALARMGARVSQVATRRWCGEPVGELRVAAGRLRGIRLRAASIPGLIDELPVLAVLAAGAARGRTVISGAAELRVKETDRISAVADGLKALGGLVEERPDGLVLVGGRLQGGTVDARGDHRIAMAFRIAGLLADGPVRVRGGDAIRISHPGFDRDLRRLCGPKGGR